MRLFRSEGEELRITWLGVAVIGILLACYGAAALAATKTFTWEAPTAYEDGTPLPPAELAGYLLECDDGTSETLSGSLTALMRDFAPGTYSCWMFADATNGERSLMSNTVSFTVPQPRPNAPRAFSVD